MAEETIVFIDIPTDETRGVIEQHVPPGFRLVFANADTDDKSAAAVPQADYVLVWSAYFGTKAVAAAKKAKLIQKIGEGTDRLDVALATQMGIPVAKTTGQQFHFSCRIRAVADPGQYAQASRGAQWHDGRQVAQVGAPQRHL